MEQQSGQSHRTGRPRPGGTWNTPEAIERHRRMTPEERVRKAIELSRAAIRFARAERVDGR